MSNLYIKPLNSYSNFSPTREKSSKVLVKNLRLGKCYTMLASHGLQAKFQLLPDFVNKVLLTHSHAHLFT